MFKFLFDVFERKKIKPVEKNKRIFKSKGYKSSPISNKDR